MEVILSEGFAITGKASGSKTESDALAGAYLLQSNDESDYNQHQYIPVTFGNIDVLLMPERQGRIVYGHTEDEIRAELEKLHPAARFGCTHILRAQSLWLNSKHYDVAWIVLPNLLVRELNSIEELIAICLAVRKPVLLDSDKYRTLFDKRYGSNPGAKAAENGFTVWGDRRFGHNALVQVNYNPKAISRRKHTEVVKKVTDRLSGRFPARLLYILYGMLNPSCWPNTHPYQSYLHGASMYETRGWGRKKLNEFDCADVKLLWELNRKLWKEDWYHTQRYYSYEYDFFSKAVAACLEYIHGVEDAIKRNREVLIARITAEHVEAVESRQQYIEDKADLFDLLRFEDEGGLLCEDVEEVIHEKTFYTSKWAEPFNHMWTYWLGGDYRDNRDNHREPGTDVSLASYLAEQLKTRWDMTNLAWMCRWLRREAKLLNVKMPKRPKLPEKKSKDKRAKQQSAKNH